MWVMVAQLALLVAIFYANARFMYARKRLSQQVVIPRKEYAEYEMPIDVLEKWGDQSLIGYCNECRLKDAPLTQKTDPEFMLIWVPDLCQWCDELKRLSLHLAIHGNRNEKLAA